MLLEDEINVIDSYHNLVQKTTSFIVHACKTYDFQYLVILDDDVYLRVQNISSTLNAMPQRYRLYAGQVWREQYKRKIRPVRTKSATRDKNYLSIQDYPLDEFPPFAIGPHYLLSFDLAHYIYRNRGQLYSTGDLEDVTIGVWMLSLGVRPDHLQWFGNARNSDCDNGYVSYADLNGFAIEKIHFNLKHKRPMCDGFDRNTWIK